MRTARDLAGSLRNGLVRQNTGPRGSGSVRGLSPSSVQGSFGGGNTKPGSAPEAGEPSPAPHLSTKLLGVIRYDFPVAFKEFYFSQ